MKLNFCYVSGHAQITSCEDIERSAHVRGRIFELRFELDILKTVFHFISKY